MRGFVRPLLSYLILKTVFCCLAVDWVFVLQRYPPELHPAGRLKWPQLVSSPLSSRPVGIFKKLWRGILRDSSSLGLSPYLNSHSKKLNVILIHLVVQFSRSGLSDSLRPHRLQHTRLPCPSLLPELVQTHVHRVGDAIQPSRPLSSPSLPAFRLSQHQGLFQWVISSHQVAKVIGVSASVLPMNIWDWFLLGWTGWISLQSMGLSRVFSNTAVQKHQFFGAQLSL